MSKIKYGLFDGRGEVISYSDTPSEALELQFPKDTVGYLKIGSMTKKLVDGGCSFISANLTDERMNPILILGDKQIRLPEIQKKGASFSPISPNEEYIRGLSIRELELAERVRRLESLVSSIKKKVYDTTIF